MNSINHRANQQMAPIENDYRGALMHSITSGGTPESAAGSLSRIDQIKSGRSSELSAAASRQSAESASARQQQVNEIVRGLTGDNAGPPVSKGSMRKMADAANKILKDKGLDKKAGRITAKKGQGDSKDIDGRGPAGIAQDSGPARPETVLDGSNLKHEVEFEKKVHLDDCLHNPDNCH
ncbi:MAG: hypothetical protein ACXWPM_09050 [Bdellovibrionota bacterium]